MRQILVKQIKLLFLLCRPILGWYIAWIGMYLVTSCQPPLQESTDVQGTGLESVGRGAGSALRPKSLEVLASFKSNLARAMTLPKTKPLGLSPRPQLRQAMFSGIYAIKGIPRGQLSSALRSMVGPASTECGGASCSRVFAMKEGDLEGFLDESRDLVGKERTGSDPSRKELREILLASLTQQAPSEISFDDKISKLKDIGIPVGSRPAKLLDSGPAFDALTRAEVSAIQGFTFKDYQGIRLVQTMTMDQLLAKGVSYDTIKIVQSQVSFLEKTLEKLPKTPGLVFRGISGLKRRDWEDILKYKERRSFISLGQNNMPATTSTSWSPQIAAAFLNQNADGLAVIFGIKQRSGVAVERLSPYPYEQEVLLPASAKYQITELAFVDRESDVLYVELVEVLTL